MSKRHLPVVSIVGRPNVGKSTLFNRILRRRQAVVDDQPGVTRDRHAAIAEWEGRGFMLVDTGGLLLDEEGIIESQIRVQVEIALGESDLVMLVVDGRTGPVADDYTVIDLLRRQGARFILVVTKVDAESLEAAAQEFQALGVERTYFVSGLEGRNVGDLLDDVVEGLGPTQPVPTEASIAIAVVGKPNVGKSSLVNALLQRERMIVSEIPGTTRDAIDTAFRFEGRAYTLIDTAGLRRKAKFEKGAEYFSAIRTTRSLERCDVAVMVLDASVPMSRQDYRIAALPFENGRPVVFVWNKWDLVAKETDTSKALLGEAARHLPDFDHAPSLFVSALTAQRVSRVMGAVTEVYESARREIPDEELDELLARSEARRSHPSIRGKLMRFWGMRQVGVAPPTFIVYCNMPKDVTENYRRFLRNRIRERFGFVGTPVRLLCRRQ